ncbi:hypothetical protein K493DRAFT_319566 [Basidiobolus meristosporus CBS 931.73]|uniref:Uncharacterized protein n=1 Tax=Basidiobolus meristosporus CBS 931.73 TaxID=1314790 RepID=A0A1Y1XR71_9FUNG|nr:hypothetical protein K493DRAFT_319566 [Basidiobolus meristosporus CBS 931.73]|eukprot:ORX88145.1 hypothetical protein K493DRAFT_319566 [Basidiobolus meristosporus CBS 931.73]
MNKELTPVQPSKKLVRFSRFKKVYFTHSPSDYDRTSIVPCVSPGNPRSRSQCQLS